MTIFAVVDESDDQQTSFQVNYPILAANVESSQIAGVEASTVVNVKGKKVTQVFQEEIGLRVLQNQKMCPT